MKLSYLILSAVLLSAVNTYAQNTFPANGNVGIGTSTAAYPLDVHANVNGTTGIQFTNDNTGSSARTRIFIGNGTNVGFININSPAYPTDPNSLSFWAPSSGGSLMFGTSGGERLRIDPSGNVGIGNASPQSLLHISGTGSFINQTTSLDSKSLIIQSNNGGRGLANGAQLEFAIPANSDGSNVWGQARIITVAGNSVNADATGKMILGTRRMFNKAGTGATWYYGDDVIIDGTGNVGIGTTTPQSKFEINNGSYINDNQLIVSGAEATRYYGVMGITVPSGNTVLSFGTRSNNANFFKTLNLFNGNVGIGITTPQNKLDVNGRIHAQSVLIDMLGWSDYVFKKDYQLRPLSEVKDYIDQNQHLPEVPSEEQIAKEGLNVGEMNKLLMKKVEELTLYLIEKDKQQTEQESLNRKQQEQLNKLTLQVEALTKMLGKN